MRIGLVSTSVESSGGAASYDRAFQQVFERLTIDVELTRFANSLQLDQIVGGEGPVVPYTKNPEPLTRLHRKLNSFVPRGWSQPPSLQIALAKEKIDLAWFLSPNRVISSVVSTPFVMTIWDLAHREVQGFEEFSAGGRWSDREAVFATNLGRAFRVVTDSEVTGRAIERIYGVYPQNWTSLGLPLPEREKPDLTLAEKIPGPYFYFPANYWPHKNHRVIIDALRAWRGSAVPHLVFTGSDGGHRNRLEKYVLDSGLSNHVSFYGRLSGRLVQGLIERSVAVVMPTLLGPTNYPPIEALRSTRPCILSDVHRFDTNPSAGFTFVNPFDHQMWKSAMEEVMKNQKPTVDSDWSSAQFSITAFEKVIEDFQSSQKARLTL